MRSVIILALLSTGALFAQDIPQLKLIAGGTFKMGGGYQYVNRGYKMHLLGQDSSFMAMHAESPAIGEVPAENTPETRVTVASFYLAEKEVTNKQYRDFLIGYLLSDEEKAAFDLALKAYKKQPLEGGYQELYAKVMDKAEKAGIAPKQDCWTTEFAYSYNDPMTTHYFLHPSFDHYPVVGVSWKQANAYCKWLTSHVNKQLAAKGKPLQPEFRLPTEAEWEYAARVTKPSPDGDSFQGLYPFAGNRLFDNKGQYFLNIKTGNGDYVGDNYMYTNPVGSYAPNAFGLYDMGGNVAEWTLDAFRVRQYPDFAAEKSKQQRRDIYQGVMDESPAAPDAVRVAKGGSWADYHFAAMCGSRGMFAEDQGYSRVGFRVAMIKTN